MDFALDHTPKLLDYLLDLVRCGDLLDVICDVLMFRLDVRSFDNHNT